jgi:hypothetical protein
MYSLARSLRSLEPTEIAEIVIMCGLCERLKDLLGVVVDSALKNGIPLQDSATKQYHTKRDSPLVLCSTSISFQGDCQECRPIVFSACELIQIFRLKKD